MWLCCLVPSCPLEGGLDALCESGASAAHVGCHSFVFLCVYVTVALDGFACALRVMFLAFVCWVGMSILQRVRDLAPPQFAPPLFVELSCCHSECVRFVCIRKACLSCFYNAFVCRIASFLNELD